MKYAMVILVMLICGVAQADTYVVSGTEQITVVTDVNTGQSSTIINLN